MDWVIVLGHSTADLFNRWHCTTPAIQFIPVLPILMLKQLIPLLFPEIDFILFEIQDISLRSGPIVISTVKTFLTIL